MSYTDQDKVEKYLGCTIDSSIVSNLEFWISAVTSWINTYCGKSFEATEDTRYYDGNGSDRLIVDSFVGNPTVKILEVDGTVLHTLTEGASEDYLAYPLNSTEKTELRLTVGGTYRTWFKGNYRVEVTADFGYSSSVPDDVSMAATILVSRIVEKYQKGGDLQQIRLGEYSATFKDCNDQAGAFGVYNILDKYREIQL